MPTDDDLFEVAWEAVYDIEKGLMDDFREARRQKQLEVAQQREHERLVASKIQQLWRENAPGLPTMEQYEAALRPEASAVEEIDTEIDTEGMSLEEANRIFDDDDSDDGGPPITERRGPPDPPGDAVEPNITEIVEEQTSELPEEPPEDNPPPPTIEEQVSEPPKPPEGAVEPKPGDIVDTTKPLEDKAPTNESELEAFVGDEHGASAHDSGYHFTKPNDTISVEAEGMLSGRNAPDSRPPLTKPEGGAYDLEEQHPRTVDQGFRFPETQDELTGKKHKGGLREVQTRLTDDPMIALEGLGANEGVPLVTHQGNPIELDKDENENWITGWYVRHGANGLEYYHEDTPDQPRSISELKRRTQATGRAKFPKADKKTGKWLNPRIPGQEYPFGNRDKIGTRMIREDMAIYYPMPDSHALDRQTGKKIASESMAADDAWTVVKNPHANPFTDFASVLAVNEEKPPERSIPVSDPIIMKEETPLQKLREKGFDMNEGDNLSLLPSNMLLNEDMGIQDNTSLLPAGWRNE